MLERKNELMIMCKSKRMNEDRKIDQCEVKSINQCLELECVGTVRLYSDIE